MRRALAAALNCFTNAVLSEVFGIQNELSNLHATHFVIRLHHLCANSIKLFVSRVVRIL
jgi:hypothetical protein